MPVTMLAPFGPGPEGPHLVGYARGSRRASPGCRRSCRRPCHPSRRSGRGSCELPSGFPPTGPAPVRAGEAEPRTTGGGGWGGGGGGGLATAGRKDSQGQKSCTLHVRASTLRIMYRLWWSALHCAPLPVLRSWRGVERGVQFHAHERSKSYFPCAGRAACGMRQAPTLAQLSTIASLRAA